MCQSVGKDQKKFQIEKRENEMRKQKGFSLIELLIVVADHPDHRCDRHSKLAACTYRANESSRSFRAYHQNTAGSDLPDSVSHVGYAANLVSLGPGA